MKKADPSTLTKQKLYIQKYNQQYMKRSNVKKYYIIKNWKRIGVICNNFDEMYQIYSDCTECNFCGQTFIPYENGYNYDKHLDHDHKITNRFNIRAILCRICNTNDITADYIQL
jgi:hypothetical protein